MSVDPDNMVVQMCAEGMRLEGQARPADARDCFEKAWLLAHSDYERCIAAHYFARHQSSPQDTLEWNRRALELATRQGPASRSAFIVARPPLFAAKCRSSSSLALSGRNLCGKGFLVPG